MGDEENVMTKILSELEEPRVQVPKPRIVRPAQPIIGSGLGTGRMNPKVDVSRRLIVDDGGIGLGQIENMLAQGIYEDEVDKYLADKVAASRGPRGEKLDDFYTFVNMVRNEQLALHKEAPFTRDVPASMVKSPLGNQITVIGAGIDTGEVNYSDQILISRWDGDDIESTNVTCVFSVIGNPLTRQLAVPVNGASRGFRPVGIVQFGTRGYLATAEIDIALGAQLTVCASTVLLSAKAAGPTQYSAAVTGMISPRQCVRTAPLTRTLYWNALAAAGSTTSMRIPNFAKKVYVVRNTLASGFDLTIIDLNDSAIQTITIAGSAQFGDPVLLSGDAFFVQITNNGGVATNFEIIFELGL